MSDPYIGEIRIFAGTFAPANWALCNGATLSISQNTALFSLLGTTYGGNGTTTFNLPNLQGRCVLGFGTSTTGTTYTQGTSSGTESVTLTQNNLPVHSHSFAPQSTHKIGTTADPTGAIIAGIADSTGAHLTAYAAAGTSTGTLASQQTGNIGASAPVSILSPYLVINYIIALFGIYPSRS